MQSDYLLSHHLAGQGFYSVAGREVSETTPVGKLDHLIRQHEAPESKRMWNNCLLQIAPMVLTVQIVAGVSFFKMISGP